MAQEVMAGGEGDGDSLDLRPNGTAVVTLDGKPYVLRRPNVGQYRAIRELLSDLGAEERRAKASAKAPKAKADPESEESRAEAFSQEMLSFGLLARWAAETMAMLCTDAPSADEIAPWMASNDFAARLITHWRTVPLSSSGH